VIDFVKKKHRPGKTLAAIRPEAEAEPPQAKDRGTGKGMQSLVPPSAHSSVSLAGACRPFIRCEEITAGQENLCAREGAEYTSLTTLGI
jgi:hypothetical protein